MEKYVKIIYEDCKLNSPSSDVCYSVLKEALISFGGKNTLWLDKVDYSENFDTFVQDAIDCGFVYINPTTAITIFQIKSFQHHIGDVNDPNAVKYNNTKNTTNTNNKIVKKPYSRRKRKNPNKAVISHMENEVPK